jgi:anti-sigma regulatory factor (Ser/Thr protein kinase)
MANDVQPLTLNLPSDLRLLGVARAFIEAVCRAGRLDRDTTEAIVLAFHEGISNVIRHAYRDQQGAPLQIECLLGSDRVEIRILDEGEPFNLAAVPDLNPAELRLGGRGVYLMRTLMDELSCQPRAERGNILRMVKWRERRDPHLGCA